MQESELTPTGSNLLDGRFAVFGYVVDNATLLADLQVLPPVATPRPHPHHCHITLVMIAIGSTACVSGTIKQEDDNPAESAGAKCPTPGIVGPYVAISILYCAHCHECAH